MAMQMSIRPVPSLLSYLTVYYSPKNWSLVLDKKLSYKASKGNFTMTSNLIC